MSDLISRQVAIDAVLKLTYADGAYGYTDAKELVDSLEALPSVQSERGKGKWNQIISIPNDMYGRHYCSECGKEGNPFWYFCPNCGADMRGDRQ